jgi:two-component system nitrate/nitrite sensor histidine kinase NarX
VKINQNFFEKNAALLRWAAVVFPLSLFFGLGSLFGAYLEQTVERLIFAASALVMSGLVYWLVDRSLSLVAQRNRVEEQLQNGQNLQVKLQGRLTTVLNLNQKLAEIQDERALMQSLLELIGQFTGASGSTYIPLDDWGQPLASVIHGAIPDVTLDSWKSHLDQPEIKEVCRICMTLRVDHGDECPLAGGPFDDSSEIACLPVKRGERVLGMINLYFAIPARLDPEMRPFLDSLLEEVALAVESSRLRNQELATLRQIQMVRNPAMDLSAILTNLLVDAQKTLEVDYAWLSFHGNERIPSLDIQGKGMSAFQNDEVLREFIQRVMETHQVVSQVDNGKVKFPQGLGAVLAAPISLPEGPAYGAILVANQKPTSFFPRQIRLVEIMASQAAQLIENERNLLDLEYRAVIDERTRLAREIHDGLAQTLAFLKMQVSQMQSYLARQDYSRLSEILRTSHQTLSEAYLDARQSIDFLRITPQGGMRHWLEQSIEDFQDAAGVQIHLTFQPDLQEIPQEIQSQLIRVLQEGLSNIRKHARAENVFISMRKWEEDLILEIRDDGKGFSPEDVPTISQYGLRGMRERADLIGADFQIISNPAQGTTVRLRLPNPFEETSV